MTKRRREQTADADEEQSNMSRRMSETDSSCQLQFMRTSANSGHPLRSSYTLNSSFTQESTLSNDALALGLLQGMLPNGWDCSQDNTNSIQCGK